MSLTIGHLSSICYEMLSWMIEIWVKSYLVSDSNCNVINLESPKNLQIMKNNVGLTFSVGDTILLSKISNWARQLELVINISYLVQLLGGTR